MEPTLDFFFDFSSPFAYLASTQVEAIAERTGARLRWRPLLLGAVFKALGTPNVPLHAMPEAKRRMYVKDMFRWAEVWDVPLIFPSHFPMNTVRALRVFQVLAGEGGSGGLETESEAVDGSSPAGRLAIAFAHAAFRAFWVEDRSIAEFGVLHELIAQVGGRPDDVLEAIEAAPAKEALRQATSAAIAAGVFGVPTCVVNGEMLFWGQDRLELVEKALRGWRTAV